MLLLSIIHADLKDGGPLATQKGHGGRCTSCTPFQAVNTAAPVLGPEEVVAVVTQAKGMIQLRTFIYNLGMEGIVKALETNRRTEEAQRDYWFVPSFIHILGVSFISSISLEPLRLVALH